MLVLCPNHHADFDNGMLRISPADHTIEHLYDGATDGESLHCRPNHELATEYIKYHNAQLYQGDTDN